MVEELMLDQSADEITNDIPIFGAAGLGLDSVDALQLVVALEKHFGLKIGNSDAAKNILSCVETIAAEIEKSA
jgi:acyl carrier protein